MSRHGQDRTALSRYLGNLRDFRPLTPDEERKLLGSIQRGRTGAMESLIQAHLSLVVKVANEYRGTGVPLEDLVSEGNLGLIQAAQRFDPARSNRFMTYAVWWIRKRVLRALSEQSRMIRLPDHQRTKVKKIRSAERSLIRSLGRLPSREEIATHLSQRLAQVDRALRRQIFETSLDQPRHEGDERPLGDTVRSKRKSAERTILDDELADTAKLVFAELTEQQRFVIIGRYGMAGGERLTLKELGLRMELSRERVRQIENEAKGRLQELLKRRQRLPEMAGARARSRRKRRR